MKIGTQNVSANSLPAGVTEDQLSDAVSESGYPLQLRVAAKLADKFTLTEEASYVDKATAELRSLDLSAYLDLAGTLEKDQKIVPGLVLLMECKRSELPFVFFRSVTKPLLTDFPQVHGLRKSDIQLHWQFGTMPCPIAKILGLNESALIANEPPRCVSFSKAVRKGKDLELSGSDVFRGLILPLISAMDHSYGTRAAHEAQALYFPVVVLAVAVLDAPMVVVGDVPTDLTLEPWVRIVRHESTAARRDVFGLTGFYVVDVIHVDFLDEFVKSIVLPLGDLFKSRSAREFPMFHNMTAHVSDIASFTWRDVRDPGGRSIGS